MPIMVLEETQALRAPNGRMLAPLPGKHTITKADASTLAAKRWEKYRQEAVKRITGVIAEVDSSVSTGSQAYAVVVAAQAKALLTAKDPKMSDVEKLGKIMTGLSAEESRRENGGTPGAIVAQPAALAELVMLLEQDRRQEIAKAQAIDGESNG